MVLRLYSTAVTMQHQHVQPHIGRRSCTLSEAWPACRPAKDSAQLLEVDKAVTRGLLDSALMALGSGDRTSAKGWDIEQGAQTLAGPSADPLLKLGRLTSISESSASEFTALQCRFLPAQRAGLSATIDNDPLVSALPSPL